jgi:hypothetical protein
LLLVDALLGRPDPLLDFMIQLLPARDAKVASNATLSIIASVQGDIRVIVAVSFPICLLSLDLFFPQTVFKSVVHHHHHSQASRATCWSSANESVIFFTSKGDIQVARFIAPGISTSRLRSSIHRPTPYSHPAQILGKSPDDRGVHLHHQPVLVAE